MEEMTYHIGIPGRDQAQFIVSRDKSGHVEIKGYQAKGCLRWLELLKQWHPRIQGDVDNLPYPEQKDHASLLLLQFIRRIQGVEGPYQHEELCHCRLVPTRIVELSAMDGASRVEEVTRRTSAGSGCGTCRPDIEKTIRFVRNED